MNRAAVALLMSLSLPATLAGCGKDSPAQPVARIPRDLSPAGVVRAYELGINTRNTALLDSLFTADYRFYFVTGDSAGLVAPPWLQPDESATNYAMLHGTTSVPPLQRITLSLDRNLIPFPDTRLGFHPKFHKTIRTSMNLRADCADGREADTEPQSRHCRRNNCSHCRRFRPGLASPCPSPTRRCRRPRPGPTSPSRVRHFHCCNCSHRD